MLVNKEELKKVPFIERPPLDGRTIFLQPYFDKKDNTFKMYVPDPQGDKVTWIFAEPVQACYYAESIIDGSKDIYLKVIDVIARHFSFQSVLDNLLRIIRDIVNCGSIVEKYFIFLNLYKKGQDTLIHNLIETDLEYFFGNIRSMYDLLQIIIRDLWKMARRINLPPSFAQMVKKDSQSLKAKYDLPEPFIQYYLDSKDFFTKCKDIRDNILHSWIRSGLRGKEFQVVFCTDEGFALSKLDPILHDLLSLDIWPEEKIKKNQLVSVLALISYINKKVLENLDTFSDVLIRSITPYPAISEKYKVFFRGQYNHHLIKSSEYLEKQWF